MPKQVVESSASQSSDIEEDVLYKLMQEEIEVQVQKAIKELPTLEEKVQAIAMNTYLIKKRKLDEDLTK